MRLGRISSLVIICLVSKILVALAIIIGMNGSPNGVDEFKVWSPPTGRESLVTRFFNWDSAHYLFLSENGYEKGSASCAFYPLWPATIRVAAVVFGHGSWWVSLLLANILSLVGLSLMYLLVKRKFGVSTSRDSLILTLAFPGALFFTFPYTESAFLLLVAILFWGLELKRWHWVAAASCLLPLARAVGIFVIFPLVWHFWEQQGRLTLKKQESSEECMATKTNHTTLWQWPLVLSPLIGYMVYFWSMRLWTGNAFEGFEAQNAYPYAPSIKNMFDFRMFWSTFANVQSLDGMTDSALDRAFFLLFLASLPAVWRLNRTWFWYALPTGLVPAMTSYFMSYRRYIMVLFPVFIVLAQLLAKTGQRWIFWYYVVLMAALQAWAVVRFVNFNWAG